MRIPRIYTPQALASQQTLLLEPNASKHILAVLRLKPGAPLVLFDGSGYEFEARLDAASNHHAQVATGARREGQPESPLRITLAQGISRGERMDYTLQKAVELGVAEIMPVLTERTVVRLDEKQTDHKRKHWQQLVIAACEQSGRGRVPVVHALASLDSLFSANPPHDLKLLLEPNADSPLSGLSQPVKNQILLLVGPEGGLSEAEIMAARQAGFKQVRLGPRVLRTETAALVGLSLLQGMWGDLAGEIDC
ncbi:MAG: 16S rRNA (uracil(1498)-N(3))-methyltransferase [Gammaproteobacteria bacterium]